MPEDSTLYIDQLWVPGIAAQNYLPCSLRNVGSLGIDAVFRVLAENSLAAFHASAVSAERCVGCLATMALLAKLTCTLILTEKLWVR